MSQLGTLWFGADIDLTALKQKIQNGNQSVLDALKMNYDPASYQQMVSKLKSELAKETFEIKLSTNTQSISNNLKTATNKGGINLNGIDELEHKIVRYKYLVNDLSAKVAELDAMRHKFGGSQRDNAYYDAKAELAKENAILKNMEVTQKAYAKATKDSADAKRIASSAAKELNGDSVRLNSTLLGGIHVSTRLGSALSSLFAVDAARQFLTQVIEIGGQLEKQRISMQAILGDVSRANSLFEQIKGLAVKSPFGVVELDQYSKQLAAYGIEQSNLFDMTKRLADISAGAGQDIGRLALALGHVKSATYLTGITLRQFSMNNIPMLKMLSDYYSEVEKRAVSTAEVQQRISKRQVSYEDVIEQIRRMTDEGGQFYNMQEKISESLSARFKNLKDSFDIMYGEIAESSIGDMLKGFASGATELSKNWKQVAEILAILAAQFGVIRVSAWALASIMNNVNSQTIASALSNGKLSASMLDRYVRTGQITKAELLKAVATKKVSAADAELAAATYNLTRAQLDNIAKTGKYKNLLSETTLATSRFTVAQLRLLAEIKKGNFTWYEKGLKGIRLGFSLVGSAAKAAAVSVASFMAPFAGMAAFSLVVDSFFESSRKAEEAEERMRNVAETANEAYRNMADVRDKFKVGASGGMSDDEIQTNIPDMVEQLKNYSKTAKETFNNAFAVDEEGKSIHSLSEQYEILAKAIESTTKSYELLNKNKAIIGNAFDAAEVQLDPISNIFTTITDWTDRLLGLSKENIIFSYDIDKLVAEYSDNLSEASKAELKFMRNRLDVVSTLESMGFSFASGMDSSQIMEMLKGWMKDYPEMFEEFKSQLKGDSQDAFENVIKEWEKLGVVSEEVTKRMKLSSKSLFDDFSAMYKTSDMTKWPSDWKDNVMLAVDQITKGIKNFGNLTEQQQNDIRNMLLEPFKIEVDTDEALQQVNNLLVELQNLTSKEYVVRIGVKGESSVDDIKNIRSNAENAKKIIEDYEADLKKRGILADDGTILLSKATNGLLRKKALDYQQAVDDLENAKTLAKEGGFSLFPEKTTSGGSKEDPQLKRLKEYLENVKKFYAEYKKNLDVYKNKEKSQRLAEELFGMKPGEGDRIVNNYKGVLNEIKKEIQLKDQKEGISIASILGDIDRDEAKKKADEALREIQDYISKNLEKFNLYKSLFEKTGDKNFASAAFSDGMIWDDAARSLLNKLKELTGETEIDFSMSNTAAKEHFKQIEGAYELWEKIVEITKNNYVESLQRGADSYANLLTASQKVLEVEQELAKLRKNGATPYEIEGKERELKQAKRDEFKSSSDYLNFYSAIYSMTLNEADAIGRKIRENLVDELKEGAITGEQYARAIKRIDEQIDKLRGNKGLADAAINGGPEAVKKLKLQIADDKLTRASNQLKESQDKLKEAEDKLRKEIEKLTQAETEEDADTAQQGIEQAEQEVQHRKNQVASDQEELDRTRREQEVTQRAYKNLIKIQNATKGIAMAVALMVQAYNDAKQAAAAFGEDIDAGMSDFGQHYMGILEGLNTGLSRLQSGDVLGAISGTVFGAIGSIAQKHDATLKEDIAASQRLAKTFQNSMALLEKRLESLMGSIDELKITEDDRNKLYEYIGVNNPDQQKAIRDFYTGTDRGIKTAVSASKGVFDATFRGFKSSLKEFVAETDTDKAVVKAIQSEKYFDAAYANLLIQRDELKRQLADEQGMKNKDEDKILDLKQQIAEMEIDIDNFVKDMADKLYGINFKDWASQLSEALVSAWAAGEDGAEAYRKKVSEILKDLGVKMITEKFVANALEPIMNDFLKQYESDGGILTEEGMSIIARMFDLAEGLNKKTNDFMDGLNEEAKKRGYDIKDETDSSSMSNTIKGITEQTADLLASYINGIRADVSVNRAMVAQYYPQFLSAVGQVSVLSQTQVTLQTQIAANTLRNADAADRIYNLLHGVAPDGNYVRMR